MQESVIGSAPFQEMQAAWRYDATAALTSPVAALIVLVRALQVQLLRLPVRDCRYDSRNSHFAAFLCIFSYSGFHNTLIMWPGAMKQTRPFP